MKSKILRAVCFVLVALPGALIAVFAGLLLIGNAIENTRILVPVDAGGFLYVY